MLALVYFVLAVPASPFKSKSRLEAENAALRHQLLRRKLKGRAQLTNSDRWFFVQLYRWFPSILQVFTIVRPETLAAVRWEGLVLNTIDHTHEPEPARRSSPQPGHMIG